MKALWSEQSGKSNTFWDSHVSGEMSIRLMLLIKYPANQLNR